MRGRTLYLVLLAVILLVQAVDFLLVDTTAAAKATFLQTMPRNLNGWDYAADNVLDEGVLGALQPDDYLIRVYQQAGSRKPGELLIAYFRSQTEGFGPHSPKVCLPASGWVPVMQTTRELPDGNGGTLRANYFLIQNGDRKSAVLYWYHTPGRTMVGEMEARFWLAWDTIFSQRSDIALVRIIVPVSGSNEDAIKAADDLASLAYKELRQQWKQAKV